MIHHQVISPRGLSFPTIDMLMHDLHAVPCMKTTIRPDQRLPREAKRFAGQTDPTLPTHEEDSCSDLLRHPWISSITT